MSGIQVDRMKQVQVIPLMWISQKDACLGFCSLKYYFFLENSVCEDLILSFVFGWRKLQEKATLSMHFR